MNAEGVHSWRASGLAQAKAFGVARAAKFGKKSKGASGYELVFPAAGAGAARSPKRALTRVALPRSLKAGAALVQLHVGKDRKDLLGKVLARFSRVRRDPLTVKAAPAKPKRAPKAAKKSATA